MINKPDIYKNYISEFYQADPSLVHLAAAVGVDSALSHIRTYLVTPLSTPWSPNTLERYTRAVAVYDPALLKEVMEHWEPLTSSAIQERKEWDAVWSIGIRYLDTAPAVSAIPLPSLRGEAASLWSDEDIPLLEWNKLISYTYTRTWRMLPEHVVRRFDHAELDQMIGLDQFFQHTWHPQWFRALRTKPAWIDTALRI